MVAKANSTIKLENDFFFMGHVSWTLVMFF